MLRTAALLFLAAIVFGILSFASPGSTAATQRAAWASSPGAARTIEKQTSSRYLAASISVTRHFPMLSAMILTEADAVRVRCA